MASNRSTGMKEEAFHKIQKHFREKLNQCSNVKEASDLEDKYRNISDVIKRTALHGESNSLLLIGPRGSGKTSLLEDVFEELDKDDTIKNNLLQIHLNGLLQTNDRIALQEISRQLKMENVIEDKIFGSFAESLQFLLGALKAGRNNSKSILFILEEFDLFCHHKNQTLLYNLFDISQSAQTPIVVIGITCRMDVIELLEKRVKSRFSHRQIYLFPKFSFEEFTEICYNILSLHEDFDDRKICSKWNHHLQDILKNSTVLTLLKRLYSSTKDIQAMKTLLFLAMSSLKVTEPYLTASNFVESFHSITADSKSVILSSLSILEMCLVIAINRLNNIYDGEPFNFQMIYNEYLKFAQKHSSMQCLDKAVVMKAYEHLQALELIQPNTGTNTIQKEYRLMTLLIEPSQISETLQKYPGLPTDIQQWAATIFT